MATEKDENKKKTSTKKEVEQKTTKKAPAKKTTSKKETSSSKKSTTKEPAKKSTSKKTPVKKVIDPRTGKVVTAGKKETPKKEPVKPVVKVEIKEEPKKKTKLPKKTSKELTIEVPKKEPEPLVRPTPKKQKELSKEDKVLYKQLCEAFDFVINMGNVIEDRTMDRKLIPDLALGELHVIETVNKNNNKPMTLIAKKEHVTVGALTTCVNRLVQKGYLLRTRDEMDQRVILLSITQKGKKVLKAHDKFHDDIIGLTLEGVNLAQATKVMTQFAHILEVYYDPSLLNVKEPAKKGSKKK
ncbi:MAG: MarR family transcriptional regulator [Erysipelotrichaceae bacterium]|nr:MarR family transcriptional regulator [Erysipelotrichaceae bacterium]